MFNESNIRVLNCTSNIRFPSFEIDYNSAKVTRVDFRYWVLTHIWPGSISHGGIDVPDCCRLKAPGGIFPLQFSPLLNHSFRILHILLNLWWLSLTVFLVLKHAFRMIFAGDGVILFERSEFLIATSQKQNLYFVRVFD